MPDSHAAPAYQQLESRFRRIALIGEAEGVLHWDYAAIMPSGGAEARSEQLAELGAIAHGLLVAPDTRDLLDTATNEADTLDDWQVANLREMKRRHKRASALDEDFVTRMARASSTSEQAWRRARAESDFSIVTQPLSTLIDMVREKADRIGAALNLAPYDALLDAFEPGARTASIDPVFDDLAAFLPDFLEDVLAHQARQPAIIKPEGPFPKSAQRELGIEFMKVLGFDFRHGRLDVSHHPFCGGVPDDVRITTRYDEDDFTSALMGVLHETGHALYSQGLPEDWRLQPVGEALGMSIHESQSLMMEMQVCRSRRFLEFAIPKMQAAFNNPGPWWNIENMIRVYHNVDRSLIRVDADEVTYPLHIIVRYRLEQKLLAGTLDVADIPEAWNASFADLVGTKVPDDAHGCLQDIHWFDGMIGYFPTYTLGAMTAAQFYQAACTQDPSIPAGITDGDFQPLVAWLRDNIHTTGRLESAPDLLTRVTGRPLEAAPFKAHLKSRYLPD